MILTKIRFQVVHKKLTALSLNIEIDGKKNMRYMIKTEASTVKIKTATLYRHT